jgi:hypothetical protein
MCGLDLYSPETVQLRKGRIGGRIRSVATKERNRTRHGEEEGGLTRGVTMSATERRENARAWKLGQRRLAGLGPSGRGEEERAALVGDRRGALSGCC